MYDFTRASYEKQVAREVRRIWTYSSPGDRQTDLLRTALAQIGQRVIAFEIKWLLFHLKGVLPTEVLRQARRDLQDIPEEAARYRADVVGPAIVTTTENRLELSSEDQEEALEDIQTKPRSELIGITEVTHWISVASKAVQDAVNRLGSQTVAIWITAEDEKVCPICAPLHLKRQQAWSRKYPLGPPAHPRCRCSKKLLVLKYQNQTLSQLITNPDPSIGFS